MSKNNAVMVSKQTGLEEGLILWDANSQTEKKKKEFNTCHVNNTKTEFSTTSFGMPSTESFGSSFPGHHYLQRYGKTLLAKILKVGPVPRHVAFVMDGNRRFAKRNHQETREGHNAGFESLSHILELCYNTGVNVVTIFAFSIENFNRTPYEVNSLMEITKSRLLQIVERG